jgi:tetratricopeptide (TPR) repeat protein
MTDLPPLESLIEIQGRQYKLSSQCHLEQYQIQMNVWRDGQLISEQVVDYPEQLNAVALEKFFQSTHRQRLVEMESIFRLSARVNENPTADACVKMGVIFLANDFYEDARYKFLKSIEIDPKSPAALKNYGIALTLLNDFDGAVAALNQAIELGSSFADLYYHLANVHLYRQELDAAIHGYLKALEINPRYADAHLKLAVTCISYIVQAGNLLDAGKMQELLERAKFETETAASLNPKIRNRSFLIAQEYLKNKKFQNCFQELMKTRPRYVPRIGDEIIFFFILTLLYGNEGIDVQMTEQYIEKLEKVISEYPHYADLRHHLAVAYLIKSRFDVHRSIRELKKSIDVNPQFQKAIIQIPELESLHKQLLLTIRNMMNFKL